MARMLIIDDDFEIVGILTEILKRDGHAIDSASDPVVGLQKARQSTPDLIILDYHMPGGTGAHLFESLRRNNATKAIPILFMSGEATAEQIAAETTEGTGSKFLAKPVHLDDFRGAIRELLAGREEK